MKYNWAVLTRDLLDLRLNQNGFKSISCTDGIQYWLDVISTLLAGMFGQIKLKPNKTNMDYNLLKSILRHQECYKVNKVVVPTSTLMTC